MFDSLTSVVIGELAKGMASITGRMQNIETQIVAHNKLMADRDLQHEGRVFVVVFTAEMSREEWNDWYKYINTHETYLQWWAVSHHLDRLQNTAIPQVPGLPDPCGIALPLFRKQAELEMQIVTLFEEWQKTRTTK